MPCRIITAGLLLLAELLLAPAQGWAVAVPDRPLRVITYNLLHDGAGSGFVDGGTLLEERLRMAIGELKALDPDILAVQEASVSRRHGNVPQRLAEALGLHVVFAPATERLSGFRLLDALIVGLMGFKEGSAILSRFPIVSSAVHDLPRCSNRLEPRILLRADLATPWGPVRIHSTHTARGDECQMEHVGTVVRETLGEGPSILMGDFNTGDTPRVLSTLRSEAGFVDAFRAANPEKDGSTVWQQIRDTRATVSRRVDFILVLNGRHAAVSVRSSQTVLDRPERRPDGTALWPSDHFGVLADLDVRPHQEVHASPREPRSSGSTTQGALGTGTAGCCSRDTQAAARPPAPPTDGRP